MEDSSHLGDLAQYGTDALEIQELISSDENLAEKLHPKLPYTAAEVVWAVRYEMARTVEDILARRTRVLFLDAKAAIEIAPKVAAIVAKELDKNEDWQAREIESFKKTAQGYCV